MKIISLCPASWGSNCYLLIEGEHALLIDPSASAEAICQALEKEGAALDAVLLTHGHFDHMISLDTVRQKTAAPAYVHPDDTGMLADGRKNAFFTFFGMDRAFGPAQRTYVHGDTLSLGNKTITVLHTPGHTRGSVCLLCEDVLFTGDTLFADGYGRFDLYGGDGATLMQSLRFLKTLNPALTIYPGHGECETLDRALERISL